MHGPTPCPGSRHSRRAVTSSESSSTSPVVPLLQGRVPVDGRATAYVCVDFACRPPVTDSEVLRALLEELDSN
ncbi:MAG: hypothetical protein L6435_07470 [Anaerolineae bacterium]|nr:hypothetical protein [Anaerolineae bacterium]